MYAKEININANILGIRTVIYYCRIKKKSYHYKSNISNSITYPFELQPLH